MTVQKKSQPVEGIGYAEKRGCECSHRQTTHEVCLKIIKETAEGETSKYSREPYRVMTCTVCGNRIFQRMNNA